MMERLQTHQLILFDLQKVSIIAETKNKESTLEKIALLCWLIPDSATATAVNEKQQIHWQTLVSAEEAWLIQEAQD